MKCQSCKKRKAVYRVGNNGFNAKKDAKVCRDFACMTWASGGYPVTFHLIDKEKR